MRRRIAALLTGHLLLSGMVFGILRVLQTGYNTTHREQLCMASLNYGSDRARLSVLGWSCEIPAFLPSEDSPLYLAVYFLGSSEVHLWTWILHEFMKWM